MGFASGCLKISCVYFVPLLVVVIIGVSRIPDPKSKEVAPKYANEYKISSLKLPGDAVSNGIMGVTFYPGEGNSRYLIADGGTLRRVDVKAGTVETLAGNKSCTSGLRFLCPLTGMCDHNVTDACDLFRKPVIDPITKDIFFVAQTKSVLMRIDGTTGDASVVAGTYGKTGCVGDGVLASDALFHWLHGVAIHPGTGDLYLSDSENHAVRKIDRKTNIITTVVGTLGTQGFSGDGGPATMAKLNHPPHCDFDPASHDMYIVDYGNEAIRRVDAKTGIITTVAGDPSQNGILEQLRGGMLGLMARGFSHARYHPFLKEGVPATSSRLGPSSFVTIHPTTRDLYISSYEPAHLVRRVSKSTGILTTIAGTQWKAGYSGDGGPASEATLNTPQGLIIDPVTGNLWIADSKNNAIRILTLSESDASP